MTTPSAAFRDFSLRSIDGEPLPMSRFAGQVVLLVNVASQCGFTPQYEGLERLWRTFRDRGLVVIGCPCDQFGAQEPGNEAEIAQFCSLNYDVTFPLTAKLEVNGDHADPLWQWMKAEEPGVLGTTAVKWNFTKFLIGRDGAVLERFAPTVTPDELVKPVEQALSAPPVVG
jgi:glutathione peroxidase